MILDKKNTPLRLLFEKVHVGICFTGADLTFLEPNKAFLDLTGYTHEQLENMDLYHLCQGDTKKAIRFHQDQLLRGNKESYRIEVTLCTGKNNIIWSDLAVTAIRNTENNLLYCSILLEDISFRHKMEQDLLESENKFRNLFTSSTDAIAIFNEARIVDCNESLCHLFETTKEEMKATNPVDFAPPVQPGGLATHEKMKQQIQESDKGEKHPAEWTFQTAKGRFFTAEMTLTPVLTGGLKYYQAVIRDITERKLAEQTLLESEEKLRRMLENSSDGITIVDREGKRIFISGNVEKKLGYNPYDLLGISGYSLIHPDDVEKADAAFSKILKKDNSTEMLTYRIRKNDGSWVYVESSIKNLLHDPLINGIIVNSREITERVETEKALKIYENIVSTSKELMAFIDTGGKILACNDAFYTGLSCAPFSRDELTLDIIFSEGGVLSSIRESFTSCLAGNEIHTMTWFGKSEEMSILLDISMYPFIGERKDVSGIVMNCRNTTRELQQEMEILNSTERERRRIGIELHDGLSHELLDIAIKSRMLADHLHDLDLPESEEALEIERKINQAITTTRGMAHGLFPVDLEKTGIEGLLSEIVIMLEEQEGIRCRLNVDPSLSIDNQKKALHLHYILQESVVNIIRHSHATEVTISMQQNKSRLVLEISDNGRGIKKKRKREGMGINIMHYRARLIGANLSIESSPGKGTKISCNFKV